MDVLGRNVIIFHMLIGNMQIVLGTNMFIISKSKSMSPSMSPGCYAMSLSARLLLSTPYLPPPPPPKHVGMESARPWKPVTPAVILRRY